MGAFSSGVKAYIFGKASVEVPFPVDLNGNSHVACQFCRFLGSTNRVCRLNGEIVEFPDKYIGSKCPLDFFDEIEEINNDDL